jgi:cobyrinic acid a,c-diamide synthase
MTERNIPRLILGAPMSGSGKTTITAGLIAAFSARGLRVAPFKVGPDYIDPGYHTLAAGRTCHNLDAWILTPDRLRGLFARRTQDADLALIEGVMGLFDGFSGKEDAGSTAHVARILDAPVLLVLDVAAMARSAAAVVQGIRDFDPRVRLAGVILNRVGSEGHARMVRDAIEQNVRVPVVGYLKRDEALSLPERHLGLIPAPEFTAPLANEGSGKQYNGLAFSGPAGHGQVDASPGCWQRWLAAVREQVTAAVDLDQVLELARGAPPLVAGDEGLFTFVHSTRAVVAVARDEAFNFIYEENLDLLRGAGAEIAFFSPLRDRALPRRAQALYLSGGFPEVYAADLSANEQMRAEIRRAFGAGLPIYAECGGLMYLTEEIIDGAGGGYRMVGILPGGSAMTGHLTLGYRVARAPRGNWLWREGETIRGHEFHYSVWENRPADLAPAYELLPGEFQPAPRTEGACVNNLIASYVHLHFLALPELAERFVGAAAPVTETQS